MTEDRTPTPDVDRSTPDAPADAASFEALDRTLDRLEDDPALQNGLDPDSEVVEGLTVRDLLTAFDDADRLLEYVDDLERELRYSKQAGSSTDPE